MSLSFPQMRYSLNMGAAMAGQPDGSFEQGRDVISVILEGNSDWGLAVCTGAGGWGYGITPAQAGDLAAGKFLGFALMQLIREPRDPRFKATDAIGVMRKGRIYLPVAHTVADGVVPFIVYSGATAGQIRDDNTNAAQCAGVRVLKGATTGGIALVEVNLAV